MNASLRSQLQLPTKRPIVCAGIDFRQRWQWARILLYCGAAADVLVDLLGLGEMFLQSRQHLSRNIRITLAVVRSRLLPRAPSPGILCLLEGLDRLLMIAHHRIHIRLVECSAAEP